MDQKVEGDKFKDLGNKAFQSGNYEEAVEMFSKAIEVNPNEAVYYSNRSGSYASLKNYDKALEDGTKCVQLRPEWGKAYQRKGLAEFYTGDYDAAISTYEEGLKIEPNNAQLKDGLSRAQEEKQGGGAKGGMDGFAQQMMMKLMMNPKTREYMKDPSFMQKLQAIQTNPQNAAAYMNDPKIMEAFQIMFSDMAGGAGGSGFNPGANTNMEEEIPESQPKSQPEPKPEPKKESAPVSEGEQAKLLGNEQYKKKNFQEAIVHYNKAIELSPTEVLYLNNKAAALIELKDYQEALKVCEEAWKCIEDNNILDFVKRGKILARTASVYNHLEDYQKAVEFYEKSLLEDNNQNVRDSLKKLQKMMAELEAKKYINPEIAEEHNEKGKEIFKTGKFPDALKEYEEAIKRNPADAKYYLNAGICLIKLLEFPGALKKVEKALDLDPKYVKAWAKKADIHFGMKEFHKADEAFKKGLAIDPSNQECSAGVKKVQMAMYTTQGEDAEERARHAMADPEIQAILQNPQITHVLRSAQENPKSNELAKALNDPDIGPQLNKLIAAGIIRLG